MYDEELRKMLLYYTVSGPKPELEARTRRLMRDELMPSLVPEATTEGKWIFLLTGMAVVLSMGMFYIFTVETILWYIVPSYLINFIRHTMYALTAAECCILTCTLIIFVFKQIVEQKAEITMSTIKLPTAFNGQN